MNLCTVLFSVLSVFVSRVVAASPISVVSTAQSAPENVTEIVGVENHPVLMPCDITPPNDREQVYLVLWYRQDDGEPIYSYDARNGNAVAGEHWSDQAAFGDRASFRKLYEQLNSNCTLIGTTYDKSHLLVRNVRYKESGFYRCRVDFKTAPTRNSILKLSVVVPPSDPVIYDESGREASYKIGPYLDGDRVILNCVVSEGDPVPEVTWWRDNRLIDSTFSNGVKNTLTLTKVTKDDLGAKLTCQAKNNDVSIPAQKTVEIDMNFPPDRVEILNKTETISSGIVYKIRDEDQKSCQTWGSRPAAVLTWWKRNKFMQSTDSKVILNGNSTISELTIQPSPRDNGKELTCRAENTDMSNAVVEDTWELVVHFAPIVSLSLGASLDPDNIAEGNDVYFECTIKANPEVYKIIWLHDDVMVNNDPSRGVIIASSSLVLQGVSRHLAGTYACVASNLQGDTKSNTIELKVKFKPLCAHLRHGVVGIARGQASEVFCPVLAHPPPLKFVWTFNNSQETSMISPSSFTWSGSESKLKYKPDKESEYGSLSCLAINEMGEMETPCRFNIIPAGPPEMPSNCSVVNHTTDSLEVECLPGFDGGLEQTFWLEVTDLQTGEVLANQSQNLPEFQVSGLNSGRGLKIEIFSSNSAGKSESFSLEGFTLKVAELQVENPVPLEFTPVLGALIGVVVTLLFVAFVIILVLRLKYKSSKLSNPKTVAKIDDAEGEDYYCLPQPKPTKPSNGQSQLATSADPPCNTMGLYIRHPSPNNLSTSGEGGSSFGTATDSSERTPPYVSRNQGNCKIATLERKNNYCYDPHLPLPTSPTTAPSPSVAGMACLNAHHASTSDCSRISSADIRDEDWVYPEESRSEAVFTRLRSLNSPAVNVIVNPSSRFSTSPRPQPSRPNFIVQNRRGHQLCDNNDLDIGENETKSWMPLLVNGRQQESTL